MQRCTSEVIVGCLMGLLCVGLAYISTQRGQLGLSQGNTYTLTTVFPTVTGLRVWAPVELAGIRMGHVETIEIHAYEAVVTLRLANQVRLQDDTIASIRTRGLIGEKYVNITPGGSERLLVAGGRIRDVEPPIDVEIFIRRLLQPKRD